LILLSSFSAPPSEFLFLVLSAELDDGQQVDIWKNQGMFNWKKSIGNVTWEIPDSEELQKNTGTYRWYTYYESITRRSLPGDISSALLLNFGVSFVTQKQEQIRSGLC
jgi:hypothetical protein